MQPQVATRPRIVISALRGGSGKTLLSLGIAAALRKQHHSIAPFKKGPDYIDAGWLALAAERPCYNLDPFLIPPDRIQAAFISHCRQDDIAVIEGNRGLYDGADALGSTSTAVLSKLLNAPVLLIVDCTKSTRTIAAVVLGCLAFDPDVPIRGLLLNRLAGSRHEGIIRRCIEDTCDVPVVGAMPKLPKDPFPERHMGLVPTPEHAWAKDAIADTAKAIENNVDLKQVMAIAGAAGDFPDTEDKGGKTGISVDIAELSDSAGPAEEADGRSGPAAQKTPTIGVLRDAAFSFYYPDNLNALRAAGANLAFLSPFDTDHLPPLDALYIGGGFPETHAAELADNEPFRQEIKALAEDGTPIYAECGGLMYLGDALVLAGNTYPMAGVFPVTFGIADRPQGHGYTIARVEGENPYFDAGMAIKGHEFHYSRVLTWDGSETDLVFQMERGRGFIDGRDGLCYRRVLATYTHIHALGTPSWAEKMVENAVARMGASAEGGGT